ncbi:MAG: OprD family outer membrane porin [Candidatus Eremiobacteraeota bacterium]|nr:OprD family outer membrane porin [Candidatus Eremiobacteraeota bacterium]
MLGKNLIRILLCASIVLLGSAAASADTQSTPNPVAKATPNPFTYNGYVRAFYFTRTNLVQNAGNPNRKSFNIGGKLHGEYNFAGTPFTVGATYFGAEPFGANGANPQFNPLVDNTVPGFEMSTLGEAYLQYKTKQVQIKVGNQVLNTPWANPSDSRLKPNAFQGVDASFVIGKGLTLGIDRMIRYEGRTSSAFDKSTLLTSRPAGNPAYPIHETNGFSLVDVGYKYGTQFAGSVNYYSFYDIANMLYVEGKIFPSPKSPIKPFFAAQLVNERQAGAAYLGIIKNTTIGMQIGASLNRNVDVTLGFDHSPGNIETVVAASCAAAAKVYFLPVGGTPNCVDNKNGSVTVYYGGIASPYSEAYATDPLFTTSISQGMVDRHSTGDSFKVGTTLQTNDKRIKLILSEAVYDYGSGAGFNQTREFNADATYFFKKILPGAYHGWSLRHRYAERTQPTLPFDFKYNRTQLQYDF